MRIDGHSLQFLTQAKEIRDVKAWMMYTGCDILPPLPPLPKAELSRGTATHPTRKVINFQPRQALWLDAELAIWKFSDPERVHTRNDELNHRINIRATCSIK